MATKHVLYLLQNLTQNFLYKIRILFYLKKFKHEKSRRHSFFKIDIYIINLDSRSDRLKDLLRNLKINHFPVVTRYPAIFNRNGALGCALSHISILEKFWKNSESDVILVIEDDCQFVKDYKEIENIISEFMNNDYLKVLVISPSVQGPRYEVSNSLQVSSNIQTTACYAVRRSFVPTLQKNFEESVKMLEAGHDRHLAAIDINWKKLQRKFLFAIPKKKFAYQTASFSNIENKFVDYENSNEMNKYRS